MNVTVDTNAGQVAVDFRNAAANTDEALGVIAIRNGQDLQTAIKQRASLPRGGPPGPRLITGNYVRSINRRTTRLAGSIEVEVGTNAPQARRLEMGFFGTDSLGRHYAQPAYAHFGPALDEIAPRFMADVEAAVARIAG